MNSSKEQAKILKKYRDKIGTPTWEFHVKGDIPSWIIDNALETFAKGMDRKTIVGFYDTSFNGNGKCGYVFTDDRIYCKQTLSTPIKIYYDDIKRIDLGPIKSKETSRYMEFVLKNGEVVKLIDSYVNKTPMKNFIEEILEFRKSLDVDYEEEQDEKTMPKIIRDENKSNGGQNNLKKEREELTARLKKLSNRIK